MKTVFLLSYGCDLDHNNIDFLVKERLIPFDEKCLWPNRGQGFGHRHSIYHSTIFRSKTLTMSKKFQS